MSRRDAWLDILERINSVNEDVTSAVDVSRFSEIRHEAKESRTMPNVDPIQAFDLIQYRTDILLGQPASYESASAWRGGNTRRTCSEVL